MSKNWWTNEGTQKTYSCTFRIENVMTFDNARETLQSVWKSRWMSPRYQLCRNKWYIILDMMYWYCNCRMFSHRWSSVCIVLCVCVIGIRFESCSESFVHTSSRECGGNQWHLVQFALLVRIFDRTYEEAVTRAKLSHYNQCHRFCYLCLDVSATASNLMSNEWWYFLRNVATVLQLTRLLDKQEL